MRRCDEVCAFGKSFSGNVAWGHQPPTSSDMRFSSPSLRQMDSERLARVGDRDEA